MLTQNSRTFYIHLLTISSNAATKSIFLILKAFPDLSSFQKARVQDLILLGVRRKTAELLISNFSSLNIQEEYKKISHSNCELVDYFSKDFPQRLKEIHDPPVLLYLKGFDILDSKYTTAVIGTRKCSQYGRDITQNFSKRLSEAGVCIVSGLALGIDTEAHQTAVSANNPTWAVIGSGINKIYPSRNKKLADEIIATGGAIISEFPPDSPAFPGNFPRRNRIVAGLSDVVLVVEAPKKSGALITAELALGYGRDVLAVPGNITSLNSEGCNLLIQDGAKPVLKVQDILEEYGIESQAKNALRGDSDHNNIEKQILSLVRKENEVSQEFFGTHLNFSQSEINKSLGMLELKGVIQKDGFTYRLKLE